jgi:hypothetical protein
MRLPAPQRAVWVHVHAARVPTLPPEEYADRGFFCLMLPYRLKL